MELSPENIPQLIKNSLLYVEFLAEREEILRHKWIESEKVGRDIGFEQALFDWTIKHRSTWREHRKKRLEATSFLSPVSSYGGEMSSSAPASN